MMYGSALTARHSMDLVLDEKVEHWDQSSEECASEILSVSNGLGVGFGAQGDAADGPRYSGDEIGDHKDVVPVVIVCGCDIGPASAGEGSEDADTENELWE